MKKLLAFILIAMSSLPALAQVGNDTTKYVWYKFAYGNRMARYQADTVLAIPKDTTYSKTGIAIKNGKLYAGDGTQWREASKRLYSSDGSITFTDGTDSIDVKAIAGVGGATNLYFQNGATSTDLDSLLTSPNDSTVVAKAIGTVAGTFTNVTKTVGADSIKWTVGVDTASADYKAWITSLGGEVYPIRVGDSIHLTNGTDTTSGVYAPTTGGFTNPMTTAGDIIIGGASGVAQRLAPGTSGQLLMINSGTLLPTWTTPSTFGSTGSSGAVQFSNGAGGFSSDPNYFYDDTNNRLGIGTNAPTNILHILGSSAVQFDMEYSGASSTTSGPTVWAGLSAIPTGADHRLGSKLFGAKSGSSFYNTAGIMAYSTAAWTVSSRPTYIDFETTPSGSTTRSKRVRITDAGNVLVGTTTDVSSSILTLGSTSKGFLPPRMTGAQAESISSPAEGLMVYSTDGTGSVITTKGWWGYDGTTWVKLN